MKNSIHFDHGKPLLIQSLFIVVLTMCASSSAVCQTGLPAVIQADREIGVSFSPSYVAYDEYSNAAVQDSEHGWIPGIGAKATGVLKTGRTAYFVMGGAYEFNDGASNHWSLSLTGGSPLSYSAPFRSNDLLFRAGFGLLPTRKLWLTAAPELQFREWLRQLPKAELAIREDYTFWAPGAALGASYNPLRSLVIKGHAGFRYTVSPENATVGNPSGQVPNITMALRSHPLWQFDGGPDWAFTHAVRGFVDAAYSRFGFGRSADFYYDDGKKSEYEPSSVTHLTSIDAGLAWSF